ncbi:16S rRNA (cytosine(967)-C(5))-methyltransferase RsmB [Virgibacillus salexigens]|uniref:16S rRNA (cytosine(967)-C(5))-methyltransferase RsmB n=1 Tax=Virgibacillus salexigens TaxID=61016 RepID=UPI00190A0C70|nr:16S rRNA (cytosine(967)-C(5))-methyltransferase RsmB [Virgibacillus salexigens]
MQTNQLRNSILDVLIRIDKDQGFSHLVLNEELKSGRILAKDEGLFTEIVYGTIQQKMTLDFYLEAFVKQGKKVQPWVKMLLRMSIYQMVYLDRIPDHAIIHEAVEIAKTRGHKGSASFVNGVLRSIQRKGVPETNQIQDRNKRIAITTSHPMWLVNRWIDQYGLEITEEMCKTNTKHKPITVRVQPLKVTREKAIQQLTSEGLEVEPSLFSPQGIIIVDGNILKSKLFTEGYVTIQDQTSMLVAEILHPEQNMKVLDACSAPGGKATHIAEKMRNHGEVYAHDLHAKKAKLVKEKADQLHLTNIQALAYDARKLQELYPVHTFDRILIDAPCSGLGVIRGKPEIKYHKTENDIEKLSSIQLDILNHVSTLLKEEGTMVYSTCTTDKLENETVVRRFLGQNECWQVDKTFFDELPEPLRGSIGISSVGLQIFPHTFNTDGFFLTRLKRKSSE